MITLIIILIFVVSFSAFFLIDKFANFIIVFIYPFFYKGIYDKKTNKQIAKLICNKNLKVKEIEEYVKNIISKHDKKIRKDKLEKLKNYENSNKNN